MGYGQKSISPWTKTTKSSISQDRMVPQKSSPIVASYYQLDMEALSSSVRNAPKRDSGVSSKIFLDFPASDGSMETFRVMDYSVMHPELQAQFPEIRSYIGYGLENPATVVYFSVSPEGVHAMKISEENDTEFINPYTNDGIYEAFSRSSIPLVQRVFECGVVDDGLSNQLDLNVDITAARNANDGKRRTFRLAIGTSAEYTTFHGGTVASALAAINTTMTRVNGIYDRELSIRMTLVPNNNLLISTPDNKIFENDENIEASTGIINGLIGVSNYDIGHYFTGGLGGRAYLRSVCGDNKGAGVTGLSKPVGDPFDIDFVAHEMGHQFGATHTFNGTSGECREVNRSSITAYEPGSGSTIMGYAGICNPQNVQINSNDYFHQASLQQIWTNITTGLATCSVVTATGNRAPTANAGRSYNIPISTPYRLTGASTDPDGTATHTYTWEQYDLGPAGLPTETTEFGPMVRSFQGTSNPTRSIPRLEDVLANGGTSTTFEKLASVGRVLNFALTVRDNDQRGGQTAVDNMSATTIETAGPFRVTSQSSNVTWEIGAYKTITWDVANTQLAPVNASNVNIRLSVDGGASFPILLAANVPNNGSHTVSVPTGTLTSKARLMVEAVGNIFYNVNTADFKIISVKNLLNFSKPSLTVCQPDEAVFNFVYNTYQGFNQKTTFSATNLPAGATAIFSPISATADGTKGTMTIKGIGNVVPGAYEITATGTAGSVSTSTIVSLDVFKNKLAPTTLVSPANGTAGLSPKVLLTWEGAGNTQTYLVEVSTSPDFSDIVATATTETTSYTASLEEATVYYWRVKGSNPCATAPVSSVNSFSTYEYTCTSYTATDTPIVITEDGAKKVYNSIIPVTDNFEISDVNVTVNIIHSWVRDLKLMLISPDGTKITLSDINGDFEDENYTNTVFDQEASTSIVNGTAPFTGTFIPEGDLSTLYGKMSLGNWTLQVLDYESGDGGSIESFALELCFTRALSVDAISFEGFKMFPNPNSGEFTITLQTQSQEDIIIDIYDIRGRKVFENRFDGAPNFREVIRMDNAQSGLYLVKISDGLRTVTKRVVVN